MEWVRGGDQVLVTGNVTFLGTSSRAPDQDFNVSATFNTTQRDDVNTNGNFSIVTTAPSTSYLAGHPFQVDIINISDYFPNVRNIEELKKMSKEQIDGLAKTPK